MGGALLSLLEEDARFALAGALVSADSRRVGAPAGHHAGLRYDCDWAAVGPLDVVIDFSAPAALPALIEQCLARHAALVTGTTGFDATQEARLAAAAAHIPVLQAANFSLGIAVLTRLVREAAAALHAWDLEILEAHHARKQDAPSGTALALGAAAATARGTSLEAAAVYARQGQTGPRGPGSIGFAVIRGGDVVGEHSVQLFAAGERLELVHRATDRLIFARGALEAAYWLAGKPAGRYTLDALLAARAG